MPTPFSLSDYEYAAVQAAAAPIHPQQRDAFLKALAVELERYPVVGPGVVFRAASELQRRFVVLRGPRRASPRRRSARSRADAALLHDHRRAVLAMQAAFLIALRFILH